MPKIYPAVIAATLFGFYSAVKGMFILLGFGAFCAFVWSIFVCISAWRQPQTRKIQAVRVGVWVLAIVAAFVAHDVRNRAVREQGNAIVEKIRAYTAANGHCPNTLEDIGLPTTATRKTFGGSYSCQENKMHLYYRSPLTLFDAWSYDFEKNEWVFYPD
jgi:hypothetical protein